MDKPIEALWRSYSDEVIPLDAGRVQRIECRRAFYAGALSMLQYLLQGLDNPPEKERNRAETVGNELMKFFEDLKAGKA